MAMIRFRAFMPQDHNTVKAYEEAVSKDPDQVPEEIAEAYRSLVKDNFGKLMSTMIGEIARFFDIAIKRKYDWEGYYGWIFSCHQDLTCWYGISYKADNFLRTAFAVKYDPEFAEVMDPLVDDEGYDKRTFGRDGSAWLVKEFTVEGVYDITEDDAQMEAFSKVAEDQLDLIEL